MKKILLGNEAVVRGALAGGVDFVSGYPGCPSAEIGEEFLKISKEFGVQAEWSTNEKTALEAAIGASFSGLKSLVNMKSFGINVCSDSLFPLAYTGTKAPMVIFVGDDPSCWSSAQSEQDSRGYAYLSHVPFLDPSSPQECYDFTKLGYEISEKFNTPVILRVTTRVAHQRALVEYEEVGKKSQKIGNFIKNPRQFVTLPPRVIEMKAELLSKINKISNFADKSKINRILGSKNSVIGIVASGVSYFHVLEAMQELKLDLPVLKLGFFYPLPKNKISEFIKGKKKILVAEELNPYLEKEIKAITKDAGLKAKIYGKDLLPEIGELNTEKVILALAKLINKKIPESKTRLVNVARRTAKLCEGCPYWNIFPILKRIAPEGTIFGGDIGCNMIDALPPHSLVDYTFAMGAGLGISHGVSKSTKQKLISIMGDGTFFHSGIAPLINAVYNKSNPLVLVLDNRITAMTGHQQNPGEILKIEDIVQACGVKNIKVIDQTNVQEFENAVKEFLNKDEISVIVCRKICALLAKRQKNG